MRHSGEQGIPAVVTAGARLPAELAACAGTDIKALAEVGGMSLLARVVGALRAVPEVGKIAVIGPKADIEGVARGAGADDVLPEGVTGPENLNIGLAAYRDRVGEGRVLFAASDLAFLDGEAVAGLLDAARGDDSDILFPVVSRADYERRFPAAPNEWARLEGREYTGGSVMLLRPAAVERNRTLIERVFAARKSQMAMARMLGPGFALRYALGRLSVAHAEARASQLTGCRCRALVGADPRLASDVDTLADLDYARRRHAEGNGGKAAAATATA